MTILYDGWTEREEVSKARRERGDAIHAEWIAEQERQAAEIASDDARLDPRTPDQVDADTRDTEWRDTYRSLLPYGS